MSLEPPEPFAVQLARVASRFGSDLSSSGVSQEICHKTVVALEELVGQVEGSVQSVQEAQHVRQVLNDTILDIKRGVDGLQFVSAMAVLPTLTALLPSLARRPPPPLPLEIVQMIINIIHRSFVGISYQDVDRRRVIKSCALVQRSWTPLAQRVLFQSLVLETDRSTLRLSTALQLNPTLASYVNAATVYTVRERLDAVVPSLRNLRVLHISHDTFKGEWLKGLDALEFLIIDAEELHSLHLPPLPALKQLLIRPHKVYLGIPTATAPFPSLVSLRCDKMRSDDVKAGAIALAVANQDHLQLLSLSRYEVDDDVILHNLFDHLPRFTQLRCLRLNSVEHPEAMLSIFSTLPPRLVYLTLRSKEGFMEFAERVIAQLLDAFDKNLVPSTLRHINLVYDDHYYENIEMQLRLVPGKDRLTRELKKRQVKLEYGGDEWTISKLQKLYCGGD